ncbi:phosphotransferase, partial [Leucobacter chromiireducens]|uniref:phosphotransferase n=1 Tax=Leucobacter chromiireducens TaxID=283877 RepID=UPI0013DDF047
MGAPVTRAGGLSEAQLTELGGLLATHYGVRGARFTRLGGELDLNYRVTDDAGAHTFLRASPAPLDHAAIAWQDAVLRALDDRPLPVASPRLRATGAGEAGLPVVLGGEWSGLLRLTSWIGGREVSEFGAADAGYRRQLGGLAAAVVDRLAVLNGAAAASPGHHWLAERAGDSIRATVAAVTDPGQRELIDRACAGFDAVASLLPELPRSVVHQDLHDFNLLAERTRAGALRITGVVDFNDAVFTVRVAELAVAAAYAALRQADPARAFLEVVGGYLERATLTPDEVVALFPLAVARLAVNASTWTARSRGENAAYARARMAATWPALAALVAVPAGEMAARVA